MPQQSEQFNLFGPDVGASSVRKPAGASKPRVGAPKPRASTIQAAPETTTRVRLGTKSAAIPLDQKRRAAWGKLKDVLQALDGQDIFIRYCGGSSSHFWFDNLMLRRLKVEGLLAGEKVPTVLVLWGNRDASIRIFTDQMVDVREQQYQDYTLWLVDFWNGFGEYPLNPYRPKGCVSLCIVRFKPKGGKTEETPSNRS